MDGSKSRVEIKVLSFNMLMDWTRKAERTEKAIAHLFGLDANILCLQEVVTNQTRKQVVDKFQHTHHLAFANHFSPSFSLHFYLPFFIMVIINGLLAWMSVPKWLLAAGLIIMILLVPSIISLIVNWKKIDLMALAILTSKSHYSQLECITNKSFSFENRGYLFDESPYDPRQWIWFYTRMLVLRPGYLIYRCGNLNDTTKTDLIVVNCHLVTGLINPTRKRQVLEILNAVYQATQTYNCLHVVWCGDFNASSNQPEFGLLRQHSYKDAAQEHVEYKQDHEVITWDNDRNPLVLPSEPNQRIDYIWFSSHCFHQYHYQRCMDQEPHVCSDHYGILTILEPLLSESILKKPE